jgi:F-type H+-transporting ATPase subunit b
VSATWVTFFFEAANFLLLAAVLGWFFFRPVRDLLERRRSEIEAEQKAAAEARTKAEEVLQEAQTQRVEVEKARTSMQERVRKEAEKEREAILDAARTQVDREREKLKEELVSLRRAQGRSLAADAAFAAREIVARLLERIESPDLDAQLLGEACRELEKLKDSGSLAPIVVEAAREVTEAELGALAEAAGVSADEARARIDEDLLAGFRVVTSRGLVDVSAAGLAAQAERALAGRMEQEENSG